MSIGRGLPFVATCALVFGAAGAVIGLVLGNVAPGYYRAVFRNGLDPAFRPEHVGLGLGSTQGAVCGVVVGSVFVLASSRASRGRGNPVPEAPRPRSRWAWWLIAAALVATAVAASGAAGFMTGVILGTTDVYRHAGEERAAQVRPVLAEPAFQAIEISSGSQGQLELSGSVPTEADRARLLQRLRFLFGDRDARNAVSNVDVERK